MWPIIMLLQWFLRISLIQTKGRWSFESVLLIDTQKGKSELPSSQALVKNDLNRLDWRLNLFSIRLASSGCEQFWPRPWASAS